MARFGWWAAVATAISPGLAVAAEPTTNQVQLDVMVAEVRTGAEPLLGLPACDGCPADKCQRVLSAADVARLHEALRVLKTLGHLKMVAEPRLVTLSGRPASFLSGGEMPVAVPAPGGQAAVCFQEFGTKANFVPCVLPCGKINLEMVLEQSECRPATAGRETPERSTARVQTKAEMAPGQTLLMCAPVAGTQGAAKECRRVVLVTPHVLAPQPVPPAVQPVAPVPPAACRTTAAVTSAIDLRAVLHEAAAPAKEAAPAHWPLKINAAKGRVQVGGANFEATAERLSQDGNQILLEGQVRLQSPQVELTAERVHLRFEGGKLQIRAEGGSVYERK